MMKFKLWTLRIVESSFGQSSMADTEFYIDHLEYMFACFWATRSHVADPKTKKNSYKIAAAIMSSLGSTGTSNVHVSSHRNKQCLLKIKSIKSAYAGSSLWVHASSERGGGGEGIASGPDPMLVRKAARLRGGHILHSSGLELL